MYTIHYVLNAVLHLQNANAAYPNPESKNVSHRKGKIKTLIFFFKLDGGLEVFF
jgi:hypothetical protein